MTTYLITGAAGSLGREIVDILIRKGQKVRAFDNNEAALCDLITRDYPASQFTPIYGSVRDYARIHYALREVDVCIHTAAMKNLEITETDISEMIQTNTIGTDNVAQAAIECGVECSILISTDKAVYPHSAYGSSKLLAEETWKGKSRQTGKSRFVIFRSGNFKQSAGNVLEVWNRQIAAGLSPTITDPDMERYFIDTRSAAEIVCNIPTWASNGDIVVPKMRIQKIVDLLQEQHPGCSYRLIGNRQGEKLQERLMTDDEKVVCESDEWMVIS